MILYKYTSVDSAVRILEELRIKVSPPNQFNDPFEFTPRSRNTMTIEYLLDSLRDDPEHFRPVFEQMVRNESYPYSFTRFLSDLPQVLPIKFPEFYKLYEQELSKSDLNSLEQASEFVGVLCVSAVKDSILMWSHYAQNHTGVVIGIDTTHDSFQIGSPIDKVKYRNQRVVVDQLAEPLTPKWGKQITNTILTKNREWSYEKEYRMVFRLSDLIQKQIDERKYLYFVDIWPKAITHLFLGCHASAETEKKLQSILSERRFEHLAVFKAERHPRKFSMKMVHYPVKRRVGHRLFEP